MKKTNLSFLVLIGSLLAALVCGVSAYLLSHIPLVWQVSGVIAVVGFVATLVLDIGTLRDAFSKKTTRFGLNAVIMTFVGLAIAIFANLIAVEHDIKKDLTKNKIHTLSDQSIKILKGLTQEITLKAFVSPMQIPEFEQIFDKYTYYSKMVKKEFVDVDKDPLAVQKNNVKQTGTILVESAARTVRVDNLAGADDPKTEEKITNAIIQVAKGDKKKIYFLSGHGERLLTDTGRDGFSDLKDVLEAGRYSVADLVLLDKDKVPADAEIVISAGPKSDFMEHELKLLDTYVRGGGKMLFMLEPNSSESLKPFMAKFGVDWKSKKTVLETNKLQQLAGGNPLTPIVTSYDAASPITQELRQLSIFPVPTPVEKAAAPPADVKLQSLFSTSNRSLEVAFQGDKVAVNEKTDRKGPISLAVSIVGTIKGSEPKDEKKDSAAKPEDETKKPSEFRMVVVGDADFASNSVRKFGINSDLFQNMLSWLAKEEDLIAIRPRSNEGGEFEITEERARIINLCSIVFFPFMMFLSGILMWVTRKRL